jgi:hypothetical protein
MIRLGADTKIASVITGTAGAAASTAINGTILDMAGYRSVLFVVPFGPIVGTAVTSLKVQQGNDSGLSDAADLEGSSQTVADTDDDKIFFVDIHNVQKRYVRLVVSRATANATLMAVALLYNGRKRPVTQPTGVSGEAFAGPAEGTP